MFGHRMRAPSPAFVISLIALFLALGGTSYAATKGILTKHKDAKADTTLVKRLAPSLSVKHAKTADNATNAMSATNAVNATHASSADSATNATNATNATHASNATNATNATTAQTANVANNIGAVTYVKGTVRDAPANGGSGYAESTESDAFCPAGTVVIVTALQGDRAEHRIGLVHRLDLDQRGLAVGRASHRPHGGGDREPAVVRIHDGVLGPRADPHHGLLLGKRQPDASGIHQVRAVGTRPLELPVAVAEENRSLGFTSEHPLLLGLRVRRKALDVGPG